MSAPAPARRWRSAARLAFWALLALPALFIIRAYAGGEALAMDLLHPTGETSLRLMILAMLAGPIADMFGRNRFTRAWLAGRRNLGVAAFGYAALHLWFYAVDLGLFRGALAPILGELELPGIWTGWLAFLAMLAAAAISNDAAMRRLGRWWRRLQRGLYAAVLLAAIHWWLLERDPVPALVHLGPLLLAWAGRAVIRRRRSNARKHAPA